MNIRRSIAVSSVLASLVFLLSGCGSGSQSVRTTPLTVHVNYQGKPVTAGIVKLMTEDGKHTATGQLTAEGKAEVPAAPVGKTRVVIETKMFASLPPPAKGTGDAEKPKAVLEGPRPGPYRKIPAQYETSASTHFEEIADGQKELTVTLKD